MVSIKGPVFPKLFCLLAALPHLLASQTTVTLTTSPNPSRFGAAVTLTATVTPATAAGSVTFYDGVTVLGTKSLVSGAAQMSTIALAAGSRKLRAYYAGATSNVVTQVVQAQPSAGFAIDRLSSSYGVLAIADFNGDGKADFATLDIGSTSITVWLGNGAGQFSPTSVLLPGGFYYPGPAAAADFNGDGKIDLVLAGSSNLNILLGNGDGTFQAGATLSLSTVPSSLAVGDFNGDGIVDIATANPEAGANILLGKGDGTFQPAVSYATYFQDHFHQAAWVVAGDFNGDGKPDLAVANLNNTILGTLGILLGNGDGTFQPVSLMNIPTAALGLAAADFNGDGKTDLATTNGYILLGNGDGTFRPLVTYPLTGTSRFMAVGDFNGDGNIDVLFSPDAPNTISVLFGKGDGTFQPQVIFPFTTSGSNAMVGDLNGDGKTDIAFAEGEAIVLFGTTVTVTPTGGANQSTTVGAAFPAPLQVTVKDGANPLSGVTVTFTTPSRGASAVLSSSTAVTDANGVASVTATANGVTGQYTVSATALGISTFFGLSNLTTVPASLTSIGAPQQTLVGTAFPQPLQVLLTSSGLPTAGVTVTFTAPASGPSAVLSSGTAVTNSAGVVSVTATANNIPGSYVVTATAEGATAAIPLTNIQPATVTVTLTSSANPATFGAPLTLTATVSNATPTGRVTFFDGVNILGIKPVSAGAASLSTPLLAAGNHKLTAYYRDGGSSGTSNAIAETVRTVAGIALAAQPPISLPATPGSVVVADFNGDGKADFAATLTDNASWWQVDLGSSASIGSIAIWNRTDCCGSRLSDYWVFVSNTPFLATDTPGTLQIRAGTFSSHQTSAPNPSASIPVNGAAGRYVRVQLSNPGYLSLAEVQVFGTGAQAGTNLALGKAASQSSTYPGYASDGAAAAVDGNTDGNFLDGSVTSTSLTYVSVLLGKGDGTFQPPINFSTFGTVIASGDFNGDGNTDLAVYTIAGGTVSVFLGNGDGTFRPSVDSPASSGSSMIVGDFNGDGKADIVISGVIEPSAGGGIIAGSQGTAFSYLLPGNDDGTFGAAVLYSSIEFSPIAFLSISLPAIADFDGDGKPDLAFLDRTGVVVVIPGNGIAGSQTSITASGGSTAFFTLVAGDFNGDGKTDLAAGDCILLGNGDGTFQVTNCSVGGVAASGDFNGDGIIDLVAADPSGNTTGILLGKGDGTFRQELAVQAGVPLAVADFNGDGRADILTTSPGGVTILLGVANAALSVTASGGTPQTTGVGAIFAAPLQVTVMNNGVGVSGAIVTFTTPTVGASAILVSGTSVTNAAGVASVSAFANSVAGSYTVTAQYNGISATFALTNTVQVPASITATGGTPQSATVGDGFLSPLQATVRDAGGNPASGVTVTFTAPTVGASATLSSSTAVTNASGVASVMASANHLAGSYTVTASVGSLSTSFALTNASGGGGSSDLAQGKTASQSSTLPGYPSAVASSAVDGNTDGAFFDGSVTATNLDPNPWWQVDLGASASIGTIVIWNRTDCCASRLSDYWVFVSDTPFLATDTPATLQNRTETFASHQTTTPNPSVTIPQYPPCVNAVPPCLIPVQQIQGRYVRVQLSNAGYLSLAEVQVFGAGGAPPPTNLSQGKPTTQSSTLPGYATAGAGSAVDGNTDGAFFDGSVTATNADANAWWQVDLGAPASVSSITIWNRTDCCGGRLGDYWVFVSNTPFLATDTPATLMNRTGTFASHQTTAPNPSTSILVNAQGQYVRVQLSDTDYLSLAEVQVLGTGGASISNVARGKTATQSSTLPGYATDGAPAAVDGNTNGNFFGGSVTATNLDPNPWWQVDLGASASVSSITIWNRTDCCGGRLGDYWVFVSNTPFLATDTPATLMNRAGTFASHQTTAPNPSTTITVGAPGQYVRVQLTSAGYLSLAEVQVFGQ